MYCITEYYLLSLNFSIQLLSPCAPHARRSVRSVCNAWSRKSALPSIEDSVKLEQGLRMCSEHKALASNRNY